MEDELGVTVGMAVAGVYACARKRDRTVDESGEGVVQLCAVSVAGGGGKTDRAIPSLRSLRRTLTSNICNSSLRLLLRLACSVTQSQHGTQRRPLNPPQHAQQSLGQRQLLPHSPVITPNSPAPSSPPPPNLPSASPTTPQVLPLAPPH